ncbi:hypothetical protein Pan44_12200 [Caulifigura coniformis]|uniref:ABC-2 family transporter protein n=1 Tax=Caulifigura coniformis TaxID=2527983 RepID=A0A517SAP4_9PLAN|nr:hypothetical protein [Caulifigura coniformis]QDT53204.1 hypothetical protein Pan44_12200 [Caulifigura coniformis]
MSPTIRNGVAARLVQSWALLGQVFAADTRLLSAHLIRLAAACFPVLLLVVASVIAAPRSPDRLGRAIFEGLAQWLVLLATLFGAWIPLTIARERSQGTISLLLLTGIDSGTFLLASCVARTLVVLIACTTTVPFWFLCIAFGGLAPEQVIASVTVLGTHLVVVTQLATFCAACFVRPIRLTLVVMLTVGLYTIVPHFFETIDPILGSRGLELILRPRFNALKATLLWSLAAGCFAVVLFCASCIAFGRRGTMEVESSSAGPHWVWASKGIGPRHRARVWRAPVVWKEFHAATWGWPWFLGTTFLIGPVVGLLLSAVSGCPAGIACLVTALILAIAAVCEAAIQMLGREWHEQTWDSLRLTPFSTTQLACRKLVGRLPDLTPATAMLTAGMILASDQVDRFIMDLITRPACYALVALLVLPAAGLSFAVVCLRSIQSNPLDGVACGSVPLVVAGLAGTGLLGGEMQGLPVLLVLVGATVLSVLTVLVGLRIRTILEGGG